MNRKVEVVRGGLFSTIQDLGRRNVAVFGVSPCGAADWFSARAANRLARNDLDAPLIETTLDGIGFLADSEMELAVTGAACDITVNADPAASWSMLRVHAGDRVEVSAATSGVRSYVAFHGGLEADAVLGSASTDINAGLGGLHGRALRGGDILSLKPADPVQAVKHPPLQEWPAWTTRQTLRVLPGPHLDRLGASGEAVGRGEAEFGVTPYANRQGIRLACDRPLARHGWDVTSFGVCAGCVQVGNDGQPIVLLCDHQTTGGYGVAWVVIRADLPLAAQLRPGDRVVLHAVNQADAAKAFSARLQACDRIGQPA